VKVFLDILTEYKYNNRKEVNIKLPHKIIKKLDDLGRIHIAKEIRIQVDIEEGDAMLVEVNERSQIILTKYEDKV